MNELRFPEKPTLLQEIQAIIYDEFGEKRPEGAKTLAEWELEVLAYWMEKSARLKAGI